MRKKENEKERWGKVLTPVRKYRLYFFTSSLASAGVNFVKLLFLRHASLVKSHLTRARALVLPYPLPLPLSLSHSPSLHFPGRALPSSFFIRQRSRRASGENSSARIFHSGLLKNHPRADFPRVSRLAAFLLFPFSFFFFFFSYPLFFTQCHRILDPFFFLSFFFFFFYFYHRLRDV